MVKNKSQFDSLSHDNPIDIAVSMTGARSQAARQGNSGGSKNMRFKGNPMQNPDINDSIEVPNANSMGYPTHMT